MGTAAPAGMSFLQQPGMMQQQAYAMPAVQASTPAAPMYSAPATVGATMQPSTVPYAVAPGQPMQAMAVAQQMTVASAPATQFVTPAQNFGVSYAPPTQFAPAQAAASAFPQVAAAGLQQVAYAAPPAATYAAQANTGQPVLKATVGAWQICQDNLGEYYVHVPSGQSFDQPPPELLLQMQRGY